VRRCRNCSRCRPGRWISPRWRSLLNAEAVRRLAAGRR
jgi:hypothetical protein